jgi:hypothetical protein
LLVASVQWPVTSKAFNRKDRRVRKDVKPHREKLEPDFLGSLGVLGGKLLTLLATGD